MFICLSSWLSLTLSHTDQSVHLYVILVITHPLTHRPECSFVCYPGYHSPSHTQTRMFICLSSWLSLTHGPNVYLFVILVITHPLTHRPECSFVCHPGYHSPFHTWYECSFVCHPGYHSPYYIQTRMFICLSYWLSLTLSHMV